MYFVERCVEPPKFGSLPLVCIGVRATEMCVCVCVLGLAGFRVNHLVLYDEVGYISSMIWVVMDW